MHVHNCPYVKLVEKETIVDFVSLDVLRFQFFGNKSIPEKLVGIYKVITADNLPITINFLSSGTLEVCTETGISKGKWSCDIQKGRTDRRRRSTFDRKFASYKIQLHYGLNVQEYKCVFEYEGVMMLVPLKAKTTLFEDSRNYNECLFLVKEGKGKDRPQTVEQFTSFVKEVYLHHMEDKEITTYSLVSLGLLPTFILWMFFMHGGVMFLECFLSIFDVGGILYTVALILGLMFVLILVPVCFVISSDLSLYVLRFYAQRFREKHTASEIPNMSHMWDVDDNWCGL